MINFPLGVCAYTHALVHVCMGLSECECRPANAVVGYGRQASCLLPLYTPG